MNRIIQLITVLTSILFFGCSSEISRDSAAELITQHYTYPRAEYANAAMFALTDKRKGENRVGIAFEGMLGQKMVDVTELIDQGIITKEESQIDISMPLHAPKWKPAWRYMFSSEVNDFLQPGTQIEHADNSSGWNRIKVKVYDVEFSSVTGIRYNQDKTEAVVEFNEEWVNASPFLILCINKPKIQSKRKATLRLYDDGWRVK